MEALHEAYLAHLEQLKQSIQESEEYATLQETEEYEDYKKLAELYEPAIQELYQAVEENYPLQLIALEKEMLDERLAGVFIPRILGFSILRGHVTDRVKYNRPQNHFKEILKFVVGSVDFDFIKKRVGQTIKIGFALSSDIWITNLINEINNKKVRYYLQSLKDRELLEPEKRAAAYKNYVLQFKNYHYHTADFPDTPAGLKILFPEIKKFLLHRIEHGKNNDALLVPLHYLFHNETLMGLPEYTYLLGLYANFFELNADYQVVLVDLLTKLRKEQTEFVGQYFEFLSNAHPNPNIILTSDCDKRLSSYLDEDIEDDMRDFYNTTDTVHNLGYTTEEAMNAMRGYTTRHDGLSKYSACARYTILSYIKQLMRNLEPSDYPTWFDMSKIFTAYMHIFQNEEFNQEIKLLYLGYLKKLKKTFTDKRGKDYQDIKKFTRRTFLDLDFMNEKELTNLFKTKRKKKKPVEESN